MKNWKTWKIVLFTALCLCMNIGGKLISSWLELPMWMDSFGTVLCAYVAGPVCGAMVGLTGNLAYCIVNPIAAAYSITSIALGVIIGIAARRNWFERFYGFMKAVSLTMLTALVVSVPVNMIFVQGYTGNKWGDGVIEFLLDKEWPRFICIILGQLAIEFVDKMLTVVAVCLIIWISNQRYNRSNEKSVNKTTTASVVLAIFLFCGLAAPTKVKADTSVETVDYNDYVKTVFSSNNGLPCGEANDIAQTNDGVLWIGTYAGLYRYNGREFRWIDNYESVKNVNCLYVDEEGRLWIGTNDNGLSIVIREKVVNVIDMSSGLPSNSVRCITRASDGYYYIGTTGSLQILMMNNGLKSAGTLPEVNYADSITADVSGHVAAIASDGHLFLIKNGEIKASLQLERIGSV